MSLYRREPVLDGSDLAWRDGAAHSLNTKVLRPFSDPFSDTGGLTHMSGNLGSGVIKVSAVAPDRRFIRAPARVFEDQAKVKEAFRDGELDRDVVVVVRFQGPSAAGMPELHGLTPILSVLQDRGHAVALVTDGRMSGASGKVPAVIHICPEAAQNGPLARLRDGDIIVVDANSGTLAAESVDLDSRAPAKPDLSDSHVGIGRELFSAFRSNVGLATDGAAVVV